MSTFSKLSFIAPLVFLAFAAVTGWMPATGVHAQMVPTSTVDDWCNPASKFANQGACEMAGGVWRGPGGRSQAPAGNQMPAPTSTVADWCNPSSPYASKGACQMASGIWLGPGGNDSQVPATNPMVPTQSVADWCNPNSPYASRGACEMSSGTWGSTSSPATIPTNPSNATNQPNPVAPFNPFAAIPSPLCTGPQSCGNNAQPATTAAVSAVRITANSSTLSCGGVTPLAIAVTSANNQPAANGTAVTLTASSGTIAPNSAFTSGGAVSASFTAPSTPGSVTITANAGGATGSASLTINCGGSTASAAQSTQNVAPPPLAAVGPVGPITITPPNTGDAGLLATFVTED